MTSRKPSKFEKYKIHNLGDRKILNGGTKKRIKQYWFDLGQRRCHCCGVQLNWRNNHRNSATIEHMIPRSMGGSHDVRNLLIICQKCNEKKDNKDFISWVKENNIPKKEWLIEKYTRSVEIHINKENVICLSIIKGVKEYEKERKAV